MADNVASIGTAQRRRLSDERLIAALAGGATLNEAAAVARVSRRTAARRSADPAFRARVDAFRGNVLDRALDVLGSAAVDAANVLHDVAVDAEHPVTARVTAARAVLSTLITWREQFELAARIAELEAREQARGGY